MSAGTSRAASFFSISAVDCIFAASERTTKSRARTRARAVSTSARRASSISSPAATPSSPNASGSTRSHAFPSSRSAIDRRRVVAVASSSAASCSIVSRGMRFEATVCGRWSSACSSSSVAAAAARRLRRRGRRAACHVDHDDDRDDDDAGRARGCVDRAGRWTSAITETALLTDVRAARQEGYDRVVFEFANGVPGYDVGLRRAADRRGRLRRRGRRRRRARSSASGWSPRSTPTSRRSRRRGPTPGRPVLAGHRRRRRARRAPGGFEAVLTWAVGIDEKRPFRVTTLDEPAADRDRRRLVVA